MNVQIRKHMKLLGMSVRDKVTGFRGVVTTIGFDLYGCIQAVVVPKTGSAGKQEDSRYFDVQRLTVMSKKPVLKIPDFDYGEVAKGRKGPSEKPSVGNRASNG